MAVQGSRWWQRLSVLTLRLAKHHFFRLFSDKNVNKYNLMLLFKKFFVILKAKIVLIVQCYNKSNNKV